MWVSILNSQHHNIYLGASTKKIICPGENAFHSLRVPLEDNFQKKLLIQNTVKPLILVGYLFSDFSLFTFSSYSLYTYKTLLFLIICKLGHVTTKLYMLYFLNVSVINLQMFIPIAQIFYFTSFSIFYKTQHDKVDVIFYLCMLVYALICTRSTNSSDDS